MNPPNCLYVTVVNLTGPLETFHALFLRDRVSWFLKNPVSICSRGLRDTWWLVSLFWRAFGFFVSCVVREKLLCNTESERSFLLLLTFSLSKLHWNLTFVSLKISFHYGIYFDSDKSLGTVPKKSQKSLCLARTVWSEARSWSENVQDKGLSV